MKKKILIKGPALSLSGYGEQARFALRSLREHQDKFDIFLQNIPWGKTGHMVESSEEKQWLDFLVAKTEQFKQQGGQFDISVQVTIPNEFEKIAPVNIGYTAGIETTRVSPQWIEKSRLMDKLIVVSNHSKDIFNATEYKLQNNQTGEIIDFKNTTPIDVVHFPAKKITTTDLELDLQTDFNFLSVAQWGPRKNVEATLISFLKEFKNDENVGLVLKVNFSKNSTVDRAACERRMSLIKKNFPDAKCKIYLLHGNMTDNEVQGLYTHPKIKAIVSTTHGEGFGLPLFEAVCNGLPVIAPKWSGHVDFLMAPVKEDGKERMRNHFTTIDFDLGMVNKEAVWDGVVQADSQWCHVKEFSVMDSMRKVFKNHPATCATAKKLQQHILEQFSEESQIEKMFFSITGQNAVKVNISELPKISIITSVFNGDEFIRPFLEDMTGQTIFKEKCELILINANSPGNEETVIKEYIEKYPENIIYKKLDNDPGIYACWNIAAKMATGAYLTNANLDDRKFPTFLEDLSKEMFANADVDVVYADNLLTNKPNETWNKNSSNSLYPSEQFSMEAMLRGNPPHCMPMWRKSLHDKFGYFEEKYKSASDWEFWLRCAFNGVKMSKINKSLGLYYFNPKGMSTNQENNSWKRLEEKEIFKKYMLLFQERNK